MLRKSSEDTVDVSGQEGTRETETLKEPVRSTTGHGTPIAQTSPTAKPPPASTTVPAVTAKATASSVAEPKPPGMLASLLQGSQSAEAKAYFTGLLPAGKGPSVPVSALRQPAIPTAKAGSVPTFTGFTGKLGSATSGAPKFDFSAVSFAAVYENCIYFVSANIKLYIYAGMYILYVNSNFTSLQGFHFSGISGNLETSGNLAKVRE